MVKLLAVSPPSKVKETATDVAVLELTVSINPPGMWENNLLILGAHAQRGLL